MLFYKKCGTELVGDEKFCPNCGTPVRRAKIEAEPTAEPSQPQPRATRKAVLISIVAILVIGAMIATTILISMSGKPAPFWFSDDWAKREPITASNSSDAALDNYQVKIVVPYDDDMQADFGDLRFTLENGDEVPYWIENYNEGESAIVWVRIPTIPISGTATIHMYYGNPNASSAENGDNTFEFFDDFMTDTWTDMRGGWAATTFDGRTVLQSGAAPWNGSYTMNQVTMKHVGDVSDNWAVELCSYWDSPAGGYGRYWSIIFTDLGGDTPGCNGYSGQASELFYDNYNEHRIQRTQDPGNWEFGWAIASGAPNKNTWARQTLKKFGGNISFTDTVTVNGTDNSPLTTFAYIDLAHNCEGSGAAGKLNVDWIFIRKYPPAELIPDIGAETSRGIEIDTSFLGVAIAVLWVSIIAIIYLILRSLKQY